MGHRLEGATSSAVQPRRDPGRQWLRPETDRALGAAPPRTTQVCKPSAGGLPGSPKGFTPSSGAPLLRTASQTPRSVPAASSLEWLRQPVRGGVQEERRQTFGVSVTAPRPTGRESPVGGGGRGVGARHGDSTLELNSVSRTPLDRSHSRSGDGTRSGWGSVRDLRLAIDTSPPGPLGWKVLHGDQVDLGRLYSLPGVPLYLHDPVRVAFRRFHVNLDSSTSTLDAPESP